MTFKLNITNTARKNGRKVDVDWNALNEHVVEAAGTASKSRSLPGFISGIYDLGEQPREDFEEEWKGTEEQERELIAEDPTIYFKMDGKKRFKCRPQHPCQQIAIAVDFPQIMVDKGQFFGNSSPAPLRLLLNGEFTLNGERVVGRGYPLSEVKHNNSVWGFSKNSTIHKLAEATGLLDENGVFSKERIGELIGQAAQFQFQCYMKPVNGKTYFTEEIKLAGIVPEGLTFPALDDKYLHIVNVMGENNPEHVKQMRVAIKNTIKRAINYEGSDIQAILESGWDKKEETKSSSPSSSPAVAPGVDDSLDDDIPFS